MEDYTWFTVVRNPYTRVLSEYYCRWGGIGENTDTHHTAEEMNQYLLQKIRRWKGLVGYDRHHYTPQSRYLDNPSRHVELVYFEELADGLGKLFRRQGLEIEIPSERVNATEKKTYGLKDFSPDLIQLINSVYSEDFRLLGYHKCTDDRICHHDIRREV